MERLRTIAILDASGEVIAIYPMVQSAGAPAQTRTRADEVVQPLELEEEYAQLELVLVPNGLDGNP